MPRDTANELRDQEEPRRTHVEVLPNDDDTMNLKVDIGGGALVPVGPIKLRELGIRGGLTDLGSADQVQRGYEMIKVTMERIHDLRIHAISMTSPSDWTAHKGPDDPPEAAVPYLCSTGALKLRDPLGVEMWRQPEVDIIIYNAGTDKEFWGAYFYGRARCRMFSSLWHQVTGCRFSNDPFFTKRGTIDANPGNVIKAADSNFRGNAIRKTLGLEAPAWEWLATAGLDVALIQKRAVRHDTNRGAARQRAEQTVEKMTFRTPMLAVTLKKEWGDRFLSCKDAMKRAGAQFNLDGSFRWFLEDNQPMRSLVSSLDLIGHTEEIAPNA